jgi:rhodanese-related sulfurtransferase/DNA-binding transcriptional ArsR family regulator
MMTTERRFKNAIYEQFSRIGKAASSPKRLELLDLLCQTGRTVESLASEACLTIANTSRHLQVLRGARLVEAEKNGLHVTYRIADPAVSEFFLAIRKLATDRLTEIEQITRDCFGDGENFEAVNLKTLLDRVQEGTATILDVRPTEEYLSGHLPGAISIPRPELERRLGELPKDREIVAYCRGPYCIHAAEAVELLRQAGLEAVRFEEGVQDWQERGLALACGAGAEENRNNHNSSVASSG